MSHMSSQLSTVLERMERRHLSERETILISLFSDATDLMLAFQEQPDLPAITSTSQPGVRLFPLGDFRRIWLEPLQGYTTLYFGDNGKLYEYGPELLRHFSEPNPDESNLIALRPLHFGDLNIANLAACSELLRRVWLV